MLSNRIAAALVTATLLAKEGSEEIRTKIISAMRKVDEGHGILILTDMYGGTPF